MSLSSVGELDSGTTVTVEEVFVSPDQGPVFGRIYIPAGWLPLLNTTDGHRWAEQVSSADSAASQLADDGGDGFGEWWHWLFVVLLALIVVVPTVAAAVRRVLLRHRQRADKSEDEVVPFSRAVVPESDDEQPAAQAPADTKVVPVASSEVFGIQSSESHAKPEAQQTADSLADAALAEQPRRPSASAQGHQVYEEQPLDPLHARRLLSASLEGDSLDVLQTAIARAKLAGVPEEEVWFAEVIRRRRAAAAELVRLLGGGQSGAEQVGPQWRPLWAMKASVMQSLLTRAKTDPQAVLRELRQAAEDMYPAVG